MKKIKYIFMLVLMVLALPFGVLAEEEEYVEAISESNNEVKIYFFRGEGCSHCAEAEEWFNSIEEEYGSKFEIVDFETWYNTDNSDLMTKVAKVRNEEEQATGVPYIIVGDHSWIGFDQQYTSEIIDAINVEYDKEVSSRYDVMNYINDIADVKEKNNTATDIMVSLALIAVVGLVGFGLYKTRKINE